MEISSKARTRHLRDQARIAVRVAARALTVMMILMFAYLALALAGSLLPANNGWAESQQGVRIFIYSNGVHTGIVVPKINDVQDWRRLVKAEHLSDPRYGASDHLLFGWGDRNFYLNTPTWSDLRLSIVVKSLLFSHQTLLHVDHIHDPQAGPDMRPIVISGAQYAHLTRQIEGYFRLDNEGRAQPVNGYGPDDVFYESRGRYDVFRTCNDWTGAQLRTIGVRMGIWTPFSESVMWRFDDVPAGK